LSPWIWSKTKVASQEKAPLVNTEAAAPLASSSILLPQPVKEQIPNRAAVHKASFRNSWVNMEAS